MPRGAAPQWKRRLEPILDDHLRASIARANGIASPDNGHYAKVVYAGCESKERAQEISKALYRAARYVGVSVKTEIVKAGDGTYQVHFYAIDKTHARKYMLERYGTDRTKWPYDPRRKGKVSA